MSTPELQSFEIETSTEQQTETSHLFAFEIEAFSHEDTFTMGIDGKQLKAGTVPNSALVTTYTQADGSVAFTANQPMGGFKLTGLASGTNTGDAATKGQLDAAVAGLTWIPPVTVREFVGDRTGAQIEALSPTTGDAYVATTVQALTLGSFSTAIGDLVEYNGSIWVLMAAGSGGFVAAGTRALLSTQTTLVGSYSAFDTGEVYEWDGTALLGVDQNETVDGAAVLVNGDGGFAENQAYVYDGIVGSGSWVQFSGTGSVTGGTGIAQTGNTLNITDNSKGLEVGADTLDVAGADIASTGLEVDATNSWQIRLATQGNGISGGAGSTLSVNGGTAGGDVLAATVTASGVGIDIAAIDGVGLEATGSAALQLSAQGNGISGGGGSTLSVGAANTSISVGGGGVQAAVPTTSNKAMSGSVTASDFDAATATTVVAAPAAGSRMELYVNGLQVLLTEDKLGEAFISGDGGTTARAFSAVVATDTIRWVGSVAGYELAATDRLDLVYVVA